MWYFYHDCPPERARAACERLQPQAGTVFTERCPIELPGGHSPFLARPEAFVDALLTVAGVSGAG